MPVSAGWVFIGIAFIPGAWAESGVPLVPVPVAAVQSAFLPLPDLGPYDAEKVKLGRSLFSDARLSRDNQVSCASCHSFGHGGADVRARSKGFGGAIGDANAPSVYNAFLNFRQFWDGRAETITKQIEGPIHNPKEMATDWPTIVAKLSADPDFVRRVRKVYDANPTRENITDAILRFEHTLTTPDSPFDRHLKGEVNALSPAQFRGYEKFRSMGCVSCHQGVNLGGNMFQTMGLMGDYFRDRGGKLASDDGRFAVTRDEADRHVFRVPSLRNVELTAPYFHDGSVATLPDAVRTMARYQLGRDLPPADVEDLVAFLRSLTGNVPSSVRESP